MSELHETDVLKRLQLLRQSLGVTMRGRGWGRTGSLGERWSRNQEARTVQESPTWIWKSPRMRIGAGGTPSEPGAKIMEK